MNFDIFELIFKFFNSSEQIYIFRLLSKETNNIFKFNFKNNLFNSNIIKIDNSYNFLNKKQYPFLKNILYDSDNFILINNKKVKIKIFLKNTFLDNGNFNTLVYYNNKYYLININLIYNLEYYDTKLFKWFFCDNSNISLPQSQ